jgi:hypothetical protein
MALYKYLESKWAQQLAQEGSVRLGSLELYKRIEDPIRGDRHEGTAAAIVDDGDRLRNNLVTARTPNVLLFCTSAKFSYRLMRRFACDAAIEITDIRAFAACISEILADDGYRFAGWQSVRYAPVLQTSRDFDFQLYPGLRKDVHFGREHEVRGIWVPPARVDPPPSEISPAAISRNIARWSQ